ncbi:MAG TPA: amino acid kinase, partial [Candidatus Thermoplasmatota archaeon]|nr:amino acid kinase [Candidatus Thermoplasmatota archaeon]
TPVIPGDGAPDAATRFGILSGDALMLSLARELRPRRALFATNVDGVFDRDPVEPGARLVAELRADQALRPGEAASGADVTGAMGGKLERARQIARLGIRTHVVNGLVEGRVAAALAGKDVVGTVVSN